MKRAHIKRVERRLIVQTFCSVQPIEAEHNATYESHDVIELIQSEKKKRNGFADLMWHIKATHILRQKHGQVNGKQKSTSNKNQQHAFNALAKSIEPDILFDFCTRFFFVCVIYYSIYLHTVFSIMWTKCMWIARRKICSTRWHKIRFDGWSVADVCTCFVIHAAHFVYIAAMNHDEPNVEFVLKIENYHQNEEAQCSNCDQRLNSHEFTVARPCALCLSRCMILKMLCISISVDYKSLSKSKSPIGLQFQSFRNVNWKIGAPLFIGTTQNWKLIHRFCDSG